MSSGQESEDNIDPISQSIQNRRSELFLRIISACGAALFCRHEYSDLAAVVAFIFVFYFLPRFLPAFVRLKSGRELKRLHASTSTIIHGKNAGRKAMTVVYTAGSIKADEREREFLELCSAAMSYCDEKAIEYVEIIVEFPSQHRLSWSSIFASDSHSAEFEKCGESWIEIREESQSPSPSSR